MVVNLVKSSFWIDRSNSMDYMQLETPCYIINTEEYERTIKELMDAYESRWDGKVMYGYSVKTNHYPYMLKKAMEFGWFAEIVSPEEYSFAKACDCEDKNIIYNGPQKRETVLDACRKGAIVNLDNLQEVQLVTEHLSQKEKKNVVIGIRINYNLEEECPGETVCQGIVGRFGICLENGDVEKAIHMLHDAGIKVKGLHMHQSSNSRSCRIYECLANKAVEVIQEYDLQDEIEYIDMGGGFFGGNFFPGKPNVDQYAETICSALKKSVDASKVALILEPGAGILATSMDYLVSVLNIRDIRGERVITVDGNVIHINPMMKPHPTPFTIFNPGAEVDVQTAEAQVIGGCTCMESDRIYPRDIKNIVEMDTRMLFHCCGAYMSTHNSNFINAAPNIYVKTKDGFEMIRRKKPELMLEY